MYVCVDLKCHHGTLTLLTASVLSVPRQHLPCTLTFVLLAAAFRLRAVVALLELYS